MSESKIKIRMGAIEIEYEGSTQFLKEEFLELVEAVSKLHKATHEPLSGTGSVEAASKQPITVNVNEAKIVGSTNEIAKKLGGENGTQLIVAAAAKLFFVDGKSTFSNVELRKEMNSATSFVDKSMKSNFAANLKSAVLKDKLKETGTDTYSLPAKIEDDMRAKLV